MFYSYKRQYPQQLPFRILLSDGRTRTDPDTFTPEEILDAGYVQVGDPPDVQQYQSLNWDGVQWQIRDWNQQEIDDYNTKEKQKLINYYIKETDRRLDGFAQSKSYDNINSISKYQNISDAEIASLPASDQPQVLKFRTECRYLALIAAQTWAKLYGILAEVESGVRPIPASYADIELDLPPITWPE